jgi:hypothetical protein
MGPVVRTYQLVTGHATLPVAAQTQAGYRFRVVGGLASPHLGPFAVMGQMTYHTNPRLLGGLALYVFILGTGNPQIVLGIGHRPVFVIMALKA